MLKNFLNNYILYIHKFGFFAGLKVAKTLFPKKKQALNSLGTISIDQCKNPIIFRYGTSDISNLLENFLYSEFRLPKNLNPKIIVDAGANAGYSVLKFYSNYPNATIIALEPEISNFDILKQNGNPYPNFIPLNKALWVRECWMTVENPGDDKTAFRVRESAEKIDNGFQATTIEKIIENNNIDIIDILKIDIEGAEKELFESDIDVWINKVKVLIVELHDRFKPGCAISFYTAISKYNFVQYSNEVNLVYINKQLMSEI